ncbi:MAG: SIMPL domain-containing protein [Rikenellaceae bacterium]
MKRLLLTISIVLGAMTLSAQEKNFIDQNYIEVTGRAEREVAPDEIYLNITIKEKENKGKTSLEKQEREFFKRLTALGIDIKEDLQIQDMFTLLQQYLLKKDEVLTSKSYQLRLNSTDMLSKVFQELESLSIPDVRIEKTSLSNMDEIRQEVMVMAAQSAKQTAGALAKSLGRTLGKAIFIQCYDNYPRVLKGVSAVRGTAYLQADSEDAMIVPSLDFEKIKFEQSVFIRFTLE